MHSINQALLHYMENSEDEGYDDSPTLLPSYSRSLSNCPLFDVAFESDHSWPSANLLQGSKLCRAVYANGAHLVMSGGRLLVVRESGHFCFPPWDSSVNDAHIEPHEIDGYTVLVVALTSGLYVALLHEQPLTDEQVSSTPVRMLSNAFVSVRSSVERIFATGDGEFTICLADADVVTYHVVVDTDMRVALKPVALSRARQLLRTVSVLFSSRNFRDAAYDAGRDILFVLSDTEVTVWGRAAPSSPAFAAMCTTSVPAQAVAVLAGTPGHSEAALVFADGSRASLRLNGRARELRLCSRRPLPADVRLNSVALACRGADGTTVLYDARTRTLAVAAVRFPLQEGLSGAVEVVATAPLRAPAVGLACVSAADGSGECFVAYGAGGVLGRVAAPPLGAQLRALLRAAGTGPALARAVAGLGARRAAEAIAGAAFSGGAPVASALAPLLVDVMRPSQNGRVSLGAQGIAAAARAAVQAAAVYWADGRPAGGCGRRRAAEDLKRASATLKQWHAALDTLLRPRGWLDCARPGSWTWGPGLVATCKRTDTRSATSENTTGNGHGIPSKGEMDMRTAVDAQAYLLQAVLAAVRGASVMCALRAISLGTLSTVATDGDRSDNSNNGSSEVENATAKDYTFRYLSRFAFASGRTSGGGESSVTVEDRGKQDADYVDVPDDTDEERNTKPDGARKPDAWALYESMPLERIVWSGSSDAAEVALCMHVLSHADAASLADLTALSADLPTYARLAIDVTAAIARGPGDAALAFACDRVRALRDAGLLSDTAARLEAVFPQCMPRLRLLLCARRRGAGGIAGILRALAAATSPEDAREALAAVMTAASAAGDAPLRDAARRFVFGQPLDDPRLHAWADALAAQSDAAGTESRSLTAAFCAAWAARGVSLPAAASGFSEIARSQQRLALGTRLMCMRLALDAAPTLADQHAYLVLLLQEELGGDGSGDTKQETATIVRECLPEETSGSAEEADENDELCYHFLGVKRLFEVAARRRDRGGAKVQLDLLKFHPETPEAVTAEVLHDLLAYLVDTRGAAPTDAARNVLREYYDGYAAGFPLLPVIEFLGHRNETAADIAELMLESGVPPYTVFDTFLSFLNERSELAIFGTGAAVATLAVTVAKLRGESRALCGTYLLGRIHHIMSGEHRVTLGEDDIMQLQTAETTLKMVLSAPSVSPV